ncbi:MAG: DNA-binding protein [Bacteroidetes bacterium]|nr:DNA-binding protein [Bacteroidota bacterium]
MQTEQPTPPLPFEKLPEAVSKLLSQQEEIIRLLTEQKNPQPEGDKWFDLTELCEYHPEKPTKATGYSWVHNRVIPFHKKSKKLFFLKSEIDAWLKSGRQKTVKEIDQHGTDYINKKEKNNTSINGKRN